MRKPVESEHNPKSSLILFQQIDLLANLKDLNVNTVNKDHETALHIMVKRGRLSPAISLICHGVNVDVQNKDGSTALHYAVKVSFLFIF